MSKIRNGSIYAEKGDELFENANDFPSEKKIEDFAKNVLDKTFENWILVGRDVDPAKFKEGKDGSLMGGIVLVGVKADKEEDEHTRAKNSHKELYDRVKNIDKKKHIAMMLLDVVESMCDDDQETEDFLGALLETAKRLHEMEKADAEDASVEDTIKVKVLKGFLETAIDSFKTADGKVKFMRSCIGMVLPMRVLEDGDDDLKKKLRKSMKAYVADPQDEDGDLSRGMVDSVTGLVDAVLGAVDEGKSADEILDTMRSFAGSMGIDASKLDS